MRIFPDRERTTPNFRIWVIPEKTKDELNQGNATIDCFGLAHKYLVLAADLLALREIIREYNF
jgi:hypothetical protein